jgi:hypothetical protein
MTVAARPGRCIWLSRRLVCCSGCLFAITACRGGTAAAPPFRSVDSAGVRVVASAAPGWTVADQWSLADAPRVVVGSADGPDEYQLSWISDAVLLGDGTIIIGNAGSHELRLYDRTGRFVRRSGRQGAGPGEFGQFANLQMWRLPGGGLAVPDASLARVNVFDSTGAFLHTVPLSSPPTAARPNAAGTFADGTYLATASEEDYSTPPGQISRSHVQYLRHDRAGQLLGTVVRVEAAPHMTHQFGGMNIHPYLPFTVDPQVVADSNSVVLLRRGEPELERYDLTGRLVARISWQPARRRVTPELFRRLVDADVAVTAEGGQKQLWQSYYDRDLPLPDLTPAYQGLYVDELRHLWVERYRMRWENERVWDVLAPDGRWLGAVTLPGRFWLHRAGKAFLVGTQMDSLDVERVQVYDLRR